MLSPWTLVSLAGSRIRVGTTGGVVSMVTSGPDRAAGRRSRPRLPARSTWLESRRCRAPSGRAGRAASRRPPRPLPTSVPTHRVRTVIGSPRSLRRSWTVAVVSVATTLKTGVLALVMLSRCSRRRCPEESSRSGATGASRGGTLSKMTSEWSRGPGRTEVAAWRGRSAEPCRCSCRWPGPWDLAGCPVPDRRHDRERRADGDVLRVGRPLGLAEELDGVVGLARGDVEERRGGVGDLVGVRRAGVALGVEAPAGPAARRRRPVSIVTIRRRGLRGPGIAREVDLPGQTRNRRSRRRRVEGASVRSWIVTAFQDGAVVSSLADDDVRKRSPGRPDELAVELHLAVELGGRDVEEGPGVRGDVVGVRDPGVTSRFQVGDGRRASTRGVDGDGQARALEPDVTRQVNLLRDVGIDAVGMARPRSDRVRPWMP